MLSDARKGKVMKFIACGIFGGNQYQERWGSQRSERQAPPRSAVDRVVRGRADFDLGLLSSGLLLYSFSNLLTLVCV